MMDDVIIKKKTFKSAQMYIKSNIKQGFSIHQSSKLSPTVGLYASQVCSGKIKFELQSGNHTLDTVATYALGSIPVLKIYFQVFYGTRLFNIIGKAIPYFHTFKAE